jgi:hypothetical protein
MPGVTGISTSLIGSRASILGRLANGLCRRRDVRLVRRLGHGGRLAGAAADGFADTALYLADRFFSCAFRLGFSIAGDLADRLSYRALDLLCATFDSILVYHFLLRSFLLGYLPTAYYLQGSPLVEES